MRLAEVAAVIVCYVFAAALLGVECAAGQRVALVIGNSAYESVPHLANPRRDASDVGEALGRIGFEVRHVTDANVLTMRRSLHEFAERASDAEMAIVFFAGHGIEVNGENWLIPVDATLLAEDDVAKQAISGRAVSQAVSKATRLGLVILDSCRDNPFKNLTLIDVAQAPAPRDVTRTTRSTGKGLAPTEAAGNVLVAFAAKDGTVAEDGVGRNSPFTSALLQNIEKPGLEVTFLFRVIRDEVIKITNGAQQPFLYGSLPSDAIYLKAPLPDQLLTMMPFRAPDLRPRNQLYNDSDEREVLRVVRAKGFSVPSFQIDEIEPSVPESLRRFVGIWISRKAAGPHQLGRQYMLIVTHITPEGIASGYRVNGGPAGLWDNRPRVPSRYTQFKASVQDSAMQIDIPGGSTSINLLTNGDMFSDMRFTDGRSTFSTMHPVWVLSEQEGGRNDTAARGQFVLSNVETSIHSVRSPSLPSKLRILLREPKKDTMQPRQVVLVDDGSCPEGQIKKVTAGRKGVAGSRTRECISR